MNAFLIALALIAFQGCIDEATPADTAPAADTDTDTDSDTDADSDADTDSGSGNDCDRDGKVDGIGTDEIVPCNGKLYVSERRMPVGDENEQNLVGRGLFGDEEDWCREGINPNESDYLSLSEGFISLTIPASAADGLGHIFVNVRYMPNGECVDSGERSYWGYLTDLVGVDPAVCQNPEDEYRSGMLFQFDSDGNIKNPTDCSSAEGANDPGNDDDGDDDVAGVPDDDTDTDSGDSGDDGDSGDSGDSGTDSGTDSGATITIEVTKDSSWCNGGEWELWAWNETSWTGNWPGLTSTEYVDSGTSSTLDGSLADSESGDLVWVQGECVGEGTWLAENVGGTPGEHSSSIVIDGDTYTVNYGTTDDSPSSGECNKRSSAYDMVCKLN